MDIRITNPGSGIRAPAAPGSAAGRREPNLANRRISLADWSNPSASFPGRLDVALEYE